MSSAKHLAGTVYADTGVKRYKGNPFIEALPALPSSKRQLLTCTASYPVAPTASDRRKSEFVRLAEVRMLSDVRMPLPEYHRAAVALTLAIREPYVSRNPATVVDVRRRHEIALAETKERFDAALQLVESRAMGFTIVAQTGMGKTTFMLYFLRNYPQVIEHKQYNGKPLVCVQITYLILRCPHDGTLKSLCLQFFDQIDRRLGTAYTKQAIGLKAIAPMVMLMEAVATQVSLGLLVVDELQNLRVAQTATAEVMLSMLSDILEKVGVSLLVLATPAVQPVLEAGVRNIRKLTTSGDLMLKPLSKGSRQWKTYTEIYWEYTFTKRFGKLTSTIQDAWHDASGGNYGFAAVAFYLAQLDAIGSTEAVDEVAFRRVASNQMAFLQPAVAALRSRNPDDLMRFDDLILHDPYEQLRQLVGSPSEKPPDFANAIFEEEQPPKGRKPPSRKQSRPGAKKRPAARNAGREFAPAYAREDPLRQ